MRFVFIIISVFFALDLFAKPVVEFSSHPKEFKIVAPKHCMFGDFDLIIHDAMYKNKFKVFLSLKELTSGKEKIFPILNDLFDQAGSKLNEEGKESLKSNIQGFLSSGSTIKIEPIDFTSDGVYVISICSDSTSEPSCFNKKIEDTGELLKEYQNPVKDFVSSDHVYYRQVVRKQGNKFSYLSDTVNETNAKSAKKILGKSSEVLAEITTLKSFPLKHENDTLIIGLPIFSPKKCGK